MQTKDVSKFEIVLVAPNQVRTKFERSVRTKFKLSVRTKFELSVRTKCELSVRTKFELSVRTKFEWSVRTKFELSEVSILETVFQFHTATSMCCSVSALQHKVLMFYSIGGRNNFSFIPTLFIHFYYIHFRMSSFQTKHRGTKDICARNCCWKSMSEVTAVGVHSSDVKWNRRSTYICR
jgi:hypothetical protein